VLTGGWTGLVLRRAVADRPLVASAALIILVASTVLVAAAGYPAAAAREGAISRLLAADPLATAISVRLDVRSASIADTDAPVRAVLAEAMGSMGGQITASAASESYAFGEQASGDYPPSTQFAFADELERHAHLAEGSWPLGGQPETQAVVTQRAAERLGVAVGGSMRVSSRLAPVRRLTVRVVGILVPDDPADPLWGGDPLIMEGAKETGPFTTVGPLFVTRDDFLGRTIVSKATMSWLALPDFTRLEIANIPALAAGAAGVDGRLGARIGRASTINVHTDLPAILSDVDESLAQGAAGSGVVGAQLLVLAVYSLVFVAALVVERRRGSSAMLQARGATAFNQLRLVGLEAAILAVPAAGLGVLLGAAIIRLVSGVALPATGGAPAPEITTAMLTVAAGTAVAAFLGLTAPVVINVGSIMRLRRSGIGRRGAAILTRSGLDLALVALAILALWQLRSARSGVRGFDPVDLAAPATGLLAGAILSVRLTPLIGRLLERAMARGNAIAGALAGRGIARNADAYARPVLLLVAATAIAMYSVEFDRTWTTSQRDQVAHDVGADIRGTVAKDQRPLLEAAEAYLAIPGVTAASPVIRDTFDLGPDLSSGRLIALPSTPAFGSGADRSDLAARPLSALLGDLAAARPDLPLVAIPPGTARARVTLDTSFAPASGTAPLPRSWIGVSVALVVQDASGALSRIPATDAPGEGSDVFVVSLRGGAPVASVATRPIGVVGVEVVVTPPGGPGLIGNLAVSTLETSHSPTGDGDWQASDLGPTRGAWTFSRTSYGTAAVPVPADPARPERAVIGAGDRVPGLAATTFAFRPKAFDGLAKVPMAAILDERAMAASGVGIGDTVLARHGFAETWSLTVTGVVASVPGVTGTGAAIVDLGALQAAAYGAEGTVPPAGEWWLATDGRDDRAIVNLVAAAPSGLSDLRSRRVETDERLENPVALALFGTLRLAAPAAVVFAGVGLIAAAWAAGRGRRREFAVVRALGLRRRELAAWLITEQAFPVALGVGGGVLLGIVLGFVVLPATTRAPDGAPPIPAALVAVPWDLVGLIAVAGALAVAATSALVLRGIEAVGLADTLRGTGEGAEA
jgi:FtsX-like permease family protein